MEDEIYGIDKEHAHPRAVQLVPEEFFWSCFDELAPFGSDEGDMALAEFRDWRKANSGKPTYECLVWTIESVGEIKVSEYNETILEGDIYESLPKHEYFDDGQYIFTLDISVIATGFAQLVDEGKIDEENKKLIWLAIERQKKWANSVEWEHGDKYISHMNILERVLKEA